MKRLCVILLISIGSLLYAGEELYVIPIHGDIEPSLIVFIRNGIKEAKKADAHILFDINTFGGRVDTALQITTLIGSIKDKKSIAYIPADPEGLGVSWSAGALISFSCSEIYMAEGTSIGAAAPVYMTPEGTQSAEEKTVSAVRVQMASLAEKNGYPPAVALAMVDKDIELYSITIDGLHYLKLKAELTEEQLKEAKIFLEKGKLLTLTAKQMELYRVSKGTVSSLDDILDILGIAEEDVVQLSKTLADRVVDFLTSTAVLALLMTLGLVTLYMEITSPGFGVLGAIGLIAFTIVFIGGELLGTLDSLELLLFLVGIGLLIVEVFIIPGFGLTGIAGLIAIGVSLILSQQDFLIPKWEWQWDVFNRNVLVVFIGFISSIGLISLLMIIFPRVSIFNKLILNNSNPETIKPQEKSKSITRGITITQLRPIGKIKLGNEVLEAKSEGYVIEKDKKIVVIDRIGNRVIVKEERNEASI